MRRFALLVLAVLPALALAQAVGTKSVTVTWTAPTAYAPVTGVATALELITAPAGTLTDGTYPLFLVECSNRQALGLAATLTVSGGAITAISVTSGGAGYAPGDTVTLRAVNLPGATADGALEVTAVTNPVAVALPASDINHYTIWWGPADGNSACPGSECWHAPYGMADDLSASTTSYVIPAACGDLEVEVAVATTGAAYAPFAVSNHAVVVEDTGLQCPMPRAPGLPKLSWPKG